MPWEGQEGRLPLTLEVDVEAKAAVRLTDGHESASAVFRQRAEQRIGVDVHSREVDAGEESVEQTPRKDREGEEGCRPRLRRSGFDGGERVATSRVGSCAAPPGEDHSVPSKRALDGRDLTSGVSLPDLQQRVGNRRALAVVHRPVQSYRS